MSEKKKLRSQDWFGKMDKAGFIYRSWMKNQGLPDHVFDGRPVIGICNTWSELNPCNAHFRDIAERVHQPQSTAHVLLALFTLPNHAQMLLEERAITEDVLATVSGAAWRFHEQVSQDEASATELLAQVLAGTDLLTPGGRSLRVLQVGAGPL